MWKYRPSNAQIHTHSSYVCAQHPAREVLRHTSVNHVTMVEIDAGVIEFSKEYLPTLSQGAFDDTRLELVIKDGAVFMRETEQTYDVIIVESTDPIGPGRSCLQIHFTAMHSGH